MTAPTLSQCLVTIVLTLLIGQAYSSFQLTVLHTNDIHARVQEINKFNGICSKNESEKNECFGGYARLKTEVDRQRQAHPNNVLVDGGDQFQGSLWFYLYGGIVMSHFMNQVEYDAMGLGNHEFDNGPEGLAPFLKNATFPILSSNIDASSYPDLSSIKKSTIVEVGGHQVGIIGYTTTETPFISNAANVKFHSEIESIQAEADKLKNQSVNKIIAIGHAGFNMDQEIGKNVRGVDVVVGGHTNTFLYTGTAPTSQKPAGNYPTVVMNPDGETVLVVQDYAYGKYLGELHVTFDDMGRVTNYSGNPILLDHTVPRDMCILDDVATFLPEIEKKRQDVIGTSHVNLVGKRSMCRRYECNMGNLIADGMVRQNLRHSDGLEWSKVAIAMVNAGGIRAGITQGKITVADVLQVLPFGNVIDIVEISGNTIMEILEHCASNRLDEADGWGGFLQFSGLRVIYDQMKPKGSRVHSVKVMCTDCLVPEYKPLDKMKTYFVIMQDYIIRGSGGYDMIKKNLIKRHTIGNLDADIMMDYIKENTPITTGLDGRISFLQDLQKEKLCL